MTEAQPVFDVAAEASGSLPDLALVALAVLVAALYLSRGLWRRRPAGAVACTHCASCGASRSCPIGRMTTKAPTGH